MRLLVLVPALLLAACADSAGPADGRAELTFGVTNGVRSNPTLSDPLVGAIYGNVFLASEVSVLGPAEGAAEFGAVEMTAVDLRTPAAESAPWETPPMPPGTYVFLGFYDVDGNGAVARDPDAGDPVTLPVTNQFTVVSAETVVLDAVFDLVLN